jgi:hypothetical protein
MLAHLLAACNGTRQPSNFGPKYWRVPLQSWMSEFLGDKVVLVGKESGEFVIFDPCNPSTQTVYLSPMAALLLANLLDAALKTGEPNHFRYDGNLIELTMQGADAMHLQASSSPAVRIAFPLGPSRENL